MKPLVTRKSNWYKKVLTSFGFLTLGLCLTACGPQKAKTVNQEGLNQETEGIPPIRYKAIKRGASSYAAQKALAWRSKQINHSVKAMSDKLDKAFNFNMLMLDNDIMPPILAKGENNLDASSPNALRVADATYKIIRPAHFVTTSPSWRDYLLLNYSEPKKPNNTFLPRNKKERQVWQKFAQQGWEQGIEQADSIFHINLSELKRDYVGMALYKKLLAYNMVTPPRVVKTQLGITGGGNEIRVNDRFARITGHSSLNPQSKGWKPVLHDLRQSRGQNNNGE